MTLSRRGGAERGVVWGGESRRRHGGTTARRSAVGRVRARQAGVSGRCGGGVATTHHAAYHVHTHYLKTVARGRGNTVLAKRHDTT